MSKIKILIPKTILPAVMRFNKIEYLITILGFINASIGLYLLYIADSLPFALLGLFLSVYSSIIIMLTTTTEITATSLPYLYVYNLDPRRMSAVLFIAKHRFAYILYKKYKDLMFRLYLESGIPTRYSNITTHVDNFMAGLLLVMFAPFLALLYLVIPLEYVILIVVVALGIGTLVFFAPALKYLSERRTRKNMVEYEIPVFLVFATALSMAGKGIKDIIREILDVGKGIFTSIYNEAILLNKYLNYLAKGELEGLRMYTRYMPNQEMRRIIDDYVEAKMLNSPVADVFRASLERNIDRILTKYEEYINRAASSIMIVGGALSLMALPIVLMGIMGYTSETGLLMVFLLPVTALMLSGAILMFLEPPPFKDNIRYNHIYGVISIIASTGIVLFLYYMGYITMWLGFVIVYTMVSLPYVIQHNRQYKELVEEEKRVMMIVDSLSTRLVVRNLSVFIKSIIGRLRIHGRFERLLRKFDYLYTTTRFTRPEYWRELDNDTLSWLARIVFRVVARIEARGAGSPEIYVILKRFSEKLVLLREKLRMGTKRILATLLFAELLIYGSGLFGVVMIKSMASTLSGLPIPETSHRVSVGGIDLSKLSLETIESLTGAIWNSIILSLIIISLFAGFVENRRNPLASILNVVSATILIILILITPMLEQVLLTMLGG